VSALDNLGPHCIIRLSFYGETTMDMHKTTEYATFTNEANTVTATVYHIDHSSSYEVEVETDFGIHTTGLMFHSAAMDYAKNAAGVAA